MIDFKQIPATWALCGNSQCQLAGECLRHQAYIAVPQSVTRWLCVLPTAIGDGRCQYYQKAETVRMARGFSSLFNNLNSRDARHDIRIALTAYFGSKGAYYRYKSGQRLLTPAQQQRIMDLLATYQTTDGVAFDEYVDTFDFSTP